MRITPKAFDVLAARVAALEGENGRLRELVSVYCRIAFYDGFRAATLWVPEVWNMEAQAQAFEWVEERREKMAVDVADAAEPPLQGHEGKED